MSKKWKKLKYNIKRNKNTLKHPHTKMADSVVKLSVGEPWFSLISLGLKTVEGRCNKGTFAKMKIGDIVKWFNDDFAHRECVTEITDLKYYKTFAEYLTVEGVEKCLPTMHTVEDGLSVYFKYFTKEQEAEYGVVAVKVKVIG